MMSIKKALLLFCMVTSCAFGFDKVIIWGHKLHSHTHSYIHVAFYKAFKQMGYDVYHFDNEDNIDGFDFTNSLFLTEGQVDQRIPLNDSCFYILHNCDMSKYKKIEELNRCVCLQVYTDDVLSRSTAKYIEPCIYEDVINKVLYMPWATDLLPEEIEANKLVMRNQDMENRRQRYIFWGGTYASGIFGNINEINPFVAAARLRGIKFIHNMKISHEQMIYRVQRSYMAPAIVGTWQQKQGYIPCRIFKNISYGQMGVTNSYRVSELFNHEIVYDPNSAQLFLKAEEALTHFDQNKREALMDFVKDKHTYINRINTILNFIDKVASKAQPI